MALPPVAGTELVGPFLSGLVGSAHCAGRCGGLAAACSRRTGSLSAWHLGHIATYAGLGALAGAAGTALPGPPWLPGTLATALLLWFSLALAGWLPEPSLVLPGLGQRGASALARGAIGAHLGFGVVNGLLPCGLVYSALAMSTTGRRFAPVRVDDGRDKVMVATENPPEVVAVRDGTIYVAWVGTQRAAARQPDKISIHIARSRDGGASFEPVAALPGAPAFAYGDLTAAPDGSLYLSWLDLHYYTDTLAARARDHVPDSVPVPESQVEFRVARSGDQGESFELAPVLDTIACICCRTAVAAGTNGMVHALWRHVFPGSIRDCQLATSRDGGRSFARPVRIHEDRWVLNGCPDIGPDAVVDGNGRVHVAWYTGAPGRVGLWYARSTDDGASFSEPVALLGAGHIAPSHVRLAAAGTAVYGAWEDRRQAPPRVVWGDPAKRRSYEVGRGAFPWIATAGNRVAVTWLEGDRVQLRVALLDR